MNLSQNIENVQSLQRILDLKNKEEAQQLLVHIASLILNETARKPIEYGMEWPINQVVLNIAFRNYFAILERFELKDQYFHSLSQKLKHEEDFQILYAVLLTPYYNKLDYIQLQYKCQKALVAAIQENSTSILAVIKAFNLLCRKFPRLDIDVPLQHVYFLLQNQAFGMREETLSLFSICVRNLERAKEYFALIIEFFPWTNKNKYYLLSCILNRHALKLLLQEYADFFSGLRLALSYKCLFASSQYLVKSLSNQESKELLEQSVKILIQGSLKELSNFQSQWFGRIAQKEELFILLQQQLEISEALAKTKLLEDSATRYRLILIFNMFSREILQLSKLHFFKISTELITNCFGFYPEPQLLIFKFVVDNLNNFAIEDCLEFILCFAKTHKGVEHAQYRNNILGKIPTVINYISKTYNRLDTDDSSTLRNSIKIFFKELQNIIEVDIGSSTYQPKIFALKLLEILLKSLYSQAPEKNSKNCNVTQNENLGRFLLEAEVFESEKLKERLLTLLYDPQGFDDALLLQVGILKQLNYAEPTIASGLCRITMEKSEIDECALSPLFAQVAANSSVASANSNETIKLFDYCLETLNARISEFETDPLVVCKTKSHLFGYLETINVCLIAQAKLLKSQFQMLVQLLRTILSVVLKMLNLANLKGSEECSITSAASFQDMEESLEILVKNSKFSTESNESCRKFLLMSFWLTLKACCDAATTIATELVLTSENDIENYYILEECLQINVSVLTKCRHKGAIEAAGVSIGKLTKSITSQLQTRAKSYQLLHKCLDLLFEDCHQISTTRRGAGLSIMFLHIVKNEEQRARPLLQRAMNNIILRLNTTNNKNHLQETASSDYQNSQNFDCVEALTLHYLCVLVKDTELREAMTKYYDEIMMAAMAQIDNPEWTICNAALQLFGALVPKIVGQKQATDFEQPVDWEPTEVTFMEITLKLPKTCSYILNYFSSKKQTNAACIRSIILFLGFLSKVEHLRKSAVIECELLPRFRELMWSLLNHQVEKVRKLAAVCFVRSHEFRCDLPQALLQISKLLFEVKNENFFQGLAYVIIEGTLKIKYESLHTIDEITIENLFKELQLNLKQTFKLRCNNLYTRCKILDLLLSLGFDKHSDLVSKLIENKSTNEGYIGYDIWQEKLAQLK